MSTRLAVDRRLMISLGAILAFGALRAIVAAPQSFISSEGTLAAAYLTFVGPGQATALYVPLYAICASDLIRYSLSSCSVGRNGSRLAFLRGVCAHIACLALVFALAVFMPSLVALALKSGIEGAPGSWAVFALLQLVYEFVYFLVVGLIDLTAALLTRSDALTLAITVIYGGIDTFIAILVDYHGSWWTGWMLMGYADPSNPLLAASGLLRLLALAAAFGIAAWRLMQGVDFYEVSHE